MGLRIIDAKTTATINTTTGITPSIGPSSDYTDGSWGATGNQIYSGEFFLNSEDQRLWIGAGNDALEIDLIGATYGGDPLLKTGGTMSGNIEMGTTTKILSSNGGGQIDLDNFGTPGNVLISTDNAGYGESYLDMASNVTLRVDGRFTLSGGTFSIGSVGGDTQFRSETMALTQFENISGATVSNAGILIESDGVSASNREYSMIMGRNIVNSLSTEDIDTGAVLINARNSTINGGVFNSVVIAASGCTNSGVYSVVSGTENDNSGTASFVTGGYYDFFGTPTFDGNINTAQSSIVFGYGNINTGGVTGIGNSLVGGAGNDNSGISSFVIGASNTNTGDLSAIIGGQGITNNLDNTVVVPAISFQNEGTKWRMIELQLGDWNMDTTTSLTASHSLTSTEWKTIRNISIVIRNDADTQYYDFTDIQGGTSTKPIEITSTLFTIYRTSGGTFDGADFDSTSYNRGWITFWYQID